MKKKLNGWIKYIIILVIIFAILGIILCFNIDQIQIMNKLDYNVALNEDGSMNVVETWNVYVKNTGTLFKDFYNTNKYPISDISVKNLKTNEQLEDLGYEEYHVPEGKYYAEEIKNNLSFNPSHNIYVDPGECGEDDEGEEIEIDLTVTQEQLKNVLAPIFQKAIDCSLTLLKRNKFPSPFL